MCACDGRAHRQIHQVCQAIAPLITSCAHRIGIVLLMGSADAQTQAHMYPHTRTANSSPCTHTHAIPICMRAHAYTHTQTLTQSHTHALTHSLTHSHTHTHAKYGHMRSHTRIHTHAQPRENSLRGSGQCILQRHLASTCPNLRRDPRPC